jgi:hypothetical protein
MATVFISYARQDRKRAEAIARLVEADGHSVWMDIESLVPGERFGKKIEEALESVSAVVVVWSRASVDSRWVIEEAELAARLEKLVPVRIDDVELPVGLRSFHAADLSGWRGGRPDAHCQRLLAALRECFDAAPASQDAGQPVRPPFAAPWRCRSALAIGAASCAFLAAFAWLTLRPSPPADGPRIMVVRGGQGEALGAGESIHTGDRLQLEFVSPRTLWWYVFQVDACDDFVMHFPRERSQNQVSEGERVLVPGPGRDLQLDDALGNERFYFIRTPTRELALESLVSDLLEDAAPVPAGAGGERIPKGSRQDYEERFFRIVEDLEDRCRECVDVRMHEHR